MAPTTSLNRARRSFTIITSGIVILVTASVLFGWMIGSAPLTQILPGFPVMVPNTAMALLLLASALALLAYTRGTLATQIFAVTAGVIATSIGTLTMAHYAFGIESGIDRLLLPFVQTIVFEVRPGRMSPHTALTLMAIGPAIAFLGRNRTFAHLSEICTSLVLFMAWAAILGYLFNARPLRGLTNANGMALPTAASFIFLSLGLLSANPRSLLVGMLTSKSMGGEAMRRLLPVAVLIPNIIGVFEWSGVEYQVFNVGFGVASATLVLCAVLVLIVSYFSLAIHKSDRTRRSVERDIVKKEELYRNLVDHGMGLITTHDLDGTILSINPASLNSLGYKQHEIVGQNLRSLIEPQLRREFDAYLREVKNNGISEGFLRLLTREGKRITFRFNNILITDGRTPQYVLGHAQDVTELIEMQEKLRRYSLTDPLTGLYNRRGFATMADQQIRLEKHSGTARGLTILFADMDGLKAINDTLGHEAGNEAIVEFANIIRSCTRSSDLAARWGGDEFVIMLIGPSETKSDLTIERIREKIELYNVNGGKPYKIAFSVGVAVYDINSGRTLEDEIAQADKKMYEDKRRRKQKSADDLISFPVGLSSAKPISSPESRQ